MKEIIERDARVTVHDIARKVGMSLSTVHYFEEEFESRRWWKLGLLFLACLKGQQ